MRRQSKPWRGTYFWHIFAKNIPMKILCLFFLPIVVLFSGCEKTCVEKKKEDCACIALYDPVCGCNDVTYGNACEAACAGISDYVKGPCK
ncbi:MAG: hypothetical protein RL386_629 [Bacteroidota bacterium]